MMSNHDSASYWIGPAKRKLIPQPKNALRDDAFSHFQFQVADGKIISNFTQQPASHK